MRSARLALFAPLLAAACGSSPIAPSTAASPNGPAAVALSMSLLSMGGGPGNSYGSPITVTVTAMAVGAESPGTIESAAFKVVGDAGETLVEQTVAPGVSIPPRVGGAASSATVSQTLTWPIERGYGKRVEVALVVRSAAGSTQTLSFWAPR